MNDNDLQKVGAIKERLERILGTISGKFSIEQQVLRDQDKAAVLLKIYQHPAGSEANKTCFLALVVDQQFKMGVCRDRVLEQGAGWMRTERSYPFAWHTFAPWVRSLVAKKLTPKKIAA